MQYNHTKDNKLYCLVDCNNYFVSCERLFNPSIKKSPVIVLSNNDGCAIARSEEAKALGIRMGEPIFKIENLVKRNDVKVFSSNYVLYGDISRRIMNVLKEYASNVEVYSIDEAFLLLEGFESKTLVDYVERIRREVYQHTGIPVSIGVGRTKTLAKIANYWAKRVIKTGAFCMLDDDSEHILKNIPVGKIWGVGHKREEWLNSLGITNAYQFTKLEDDLVKKKMTVVGLRTKMELCGIDCIEIEEVQDKRMIGSSRMFGNNITIFNEVNEALSAYVATTAVKLRKQNSQASHMSVHVATSRFKSGYYANSSSTYLHQPLSNTQDLTKVATGLLRNIFKSGYAYKRVGVLLSELTQRNVQPLLFQDPECEKKQKLMDILDKFNKTTNYGKIKFASEGVSKRLWEMKQTHKSKRYTTNWNELLMV